MIDIPFRFAGPEIPLVVVSARINGTALDVVLDTGNGAPATLLLSAAFIQRLGLTPSIDRESFPRVRLDRLEFGEQLFENVEAGVIAELDDIGARGGFSAAGNMGYQFIKDSRLEVDYPAMRLRILHHAPERSPRGTPFETGTGVACILVPAEVNGRGPYRFLLDTGASCSVVSPRMAAELGLSGSEAKAVSVLGDLAAQSVCLQSLTSIGHTRHDVAAAVIDMFDFTSNAAGAPVDGILGYNFLKEFVVEIDYPARQLSLT